MQLQASLQNHTQVHGTSLLLKCSLSNLWIRRSQLIHTAVAIMNHSHAYNSATLYQLPSSFGLRQDDNQGPQKNGLYCCFVFKGPRFDFWFGPKRPGKPCRRYPQNLQANIRTIPYNMPRPLPSVLIQIHHWQTALSSALEDCKFCHWKFVLNWTNNQ
jgi:hypothetical protein